MSVEKALEKVKQEQVEVGPNETSLHLLQKVYRNHRLPLSMRVRAATDALPHEHPRLTAVSVGYHDGTAFADRLDRAIEASNRAKLIEGRVIERED